MSDTTIDRPSLPSLEGYLYQVDVSVWLALDLVVSKRLADHVTLEPIGEEDLEADLSDEWTASAATGVTVGGYRLVVQAKHRSTGPWSAADLVRLLRHGVRRPPAADRLADPNTRYVLITSAALQRGALPLQMRNPTAWPKPPLPATIEEVAPGAGGRVGVVQMATQTHVVDRIDELLRDAFKVPPANMAACRKKLQDEALLRMRLGADWTRSQLEAVIREFEGFIASSIQVDRFVPPTNWPQLKETLETYHAVVITGASGTGKTTAAEALKDVLTREQAVKVLSVRSPHEVRSYRDPGPVLFMLEDPWGKYRIEPEAQPWNDELAAILAHAGPSRRFIVTSRSDILTDARGEGQVKPRYRVKLEAANYRKKDRLRLFDNHAAALPSKLKRVVTEHTGTVITRVETPLEMLKFFGAAADDRLPDESDGVFVSRCIDQALKEGLEDGIVQLVRQRQAHEAATVIWALMNAQMNLRRGWLSRLEADLADLQPSLEDKLEPLVNLLVAGRSLRQVDDTLSYQHPRIDAGLERAVLEHPNAAARTLAVLVQALVDHDTGEDDWGRQIAARVVAVAERVSLTGRMRPPLRRRLDAWIEAQVMRFGDDFSRDLRMAQQAGSPDNPVAELARWLLRRGPIVIGDVDWDDRWTETALDAAVCNDPRTAAICDHFVRTVLPYETSDYPQAFVPAVSALSPDITRAFQAAALKMVRHGYNGNDDTVALGALVDIGGFEDVLAAAANYKLELASARHDGQWLPLLNEEYDEDYADHIQSGNDDGHTAGVFIEAYVGRARQERGFAILADHPLRDELLWAWVELLGPGKVDPAPGELLALALASENHRHEARFWSLACEAWDDSVWPVLESRLRSGAGEQSVRVGVARACAQLGAERFSGVIEQLVGSNSWIRLVELRLDLADALADEETSAVACEFALDEYRRRVPADIAQLAEVLAGNERAQEADRIMLEAVTSFGNERMTLARLRALAGTGSDIGQALDDFLDLQKRTYEDVKPAAAAMDLAISHQMWPSVLRALGHPLAAVRQSALGAVVARWGAPFPDEILALAKDRGAGVRLALAKAMLDHPHAGHHATLLHLISDRHSAAGSQYGGPTAHRVARCAAAALRVGPILDEDTITAVLNVALRTKDKVLQTQLLSLMAEHSGSSGREHLRALMLERAQALSTPAARALALADRPLDATEVDTLDLNDLLRRAEVPAAGIALVLGRSAGPTKLEEATRLLATSSDRRELLVPLFVGTSLRVGGSNAKVASYLPADLVAKIDLAMNDGPKVARSALDPLGNARTAVGVMSALDWLFAKPSNTW